MDRDNRKNKDREGYYDDYWGNDQPAARRMTPEERERYYAKKDAYYAERDAYYARRDAFYASVEEDGDEEEWEEEEEEEEYSAPARTPRERRTPRRRRRRRKRHFFRTLLLLAIAAGVIALLLGTPPVINPAGRKRESGHSTLLLVGTDARGGPDTVMLLSLRRGDVRLLSIPPDTCTEDGVSPWEAHTRGEAGRQSLMTAAQALLGFSPDGLVTVDMDCFVEAAELLGGLDFFVPGKISYIDESRGEIVELKPGRQHLSGQQIVDLARWYTGRAGEEDGAMSIQRALLSAAREQWIGPANLRLVPDLWLDLRRSASTDLTRANLLWVARVLVKTQHAAVSMDVLPCRAVTDGENTVFMVDRPAAYTVLEDYDPYR